MKRLRRRTTPPHDHPSVVPDEGDLAAAIAALNSYQQATQHADAKASMLVAVHVGLTAVIASKADNFEPSALDRPLGTTLWLLSAGLTTAFLITGALLLQVIRPRTGRYDRFNRFSLAATESRWTAPSPHPHPDEDPLPSQIWAAAFQVARIATVKNQYIGRSLVSLAIMIVLSTTWLILVSSTS